MQAFLHQRVRDGEHQRHVGHRVDVLVLGAAEVVQRLAPDRVDADHLDRLVGHLLLELLEVGVGLVGLGVPAHLQVLDRVVGPKHDELAFLEDHVPGGALRIHLGRAEHVGQDHLPGAGRVVADGADAAAVHADAAHHVVAAAMHLADRAPAHAAGVQRPRAVVLLHALEFFVEQVERLVPAHAHEAVVAALAGVAEVALAVPVQTHHRVAHAGRAVDQAEQALDHLRRVLVVLEGADIDHAVADHLGADGAEVRAGDLPGGDVVTDCGSLAGRQGGPAGEQAGRDQRAARHCRHGLEETSPRVVHGVQLLIRDARSAGRNRANRRRATC